MALGTAEGYNSHDRDSKTSSEALDASSATSPGASSWTFSADVSRAASGLSQVVSPLSIAQRYVTCQSLL